MAKNNEQKKKEIEEILAKYKAQIGVLKQKRDKIISVFLELLREKKLKELRNSFKEL